MSEKLRTAFADAHAMFRAACGKQINHETSYSEWMNLDPDLHAAALFIIFFREITLARKNTFAEYVSDEDAVSEIMAKLLSVTPKIESDEKMYTGAFLYTVIYNALLSSTRVKRNAWYHSNRLVPEDLHGRFSRELDSYETIPDPKADLDEIIDSHDIIRTLNNLPEFYRRAVENLLNRSAIGRSRADRESIIMELRRIFKIYRIGEDDDTETLTFSHIYSRDDEVECADVVMPDGEIAQYYGDSYTKDGVLRIRFFGAYRDYDFAYRRAKSFKVSEVTYY